MNRTLKQTREQGLDKFYTNKDVAKNCIDIINNRVGFDKWDLIVEPSAGNGSFFNLIPANCKKIGLDIEPEDNEQIIKKDFFTYVPSLEKNILVLGNPPFGRVSSLAIKFFNHAAEWSSCIAFIIPKTFRRVSVQKRLNKWFHLEYDEDILPNSFTPNMSVKCCFQIWVKKSIKRTDATLSTTHDDWDFLSFGPKDDKGQPTPPKGADFAMKAYGSNCGEIVRENLDKLRPKSWHWIKSKIEIEELISNFKQLDYSLSKDTARQESIGKGELVSLYENKFN